MKNKLFLLLAIIAVMGFVVSLNYAEALAQQQQAPPVPLDEAKCMIPVEFSDYTDRMAETGIPTPADWGLNGADPRQVLYTEPPDVPGPLYPCNTFDFSDIEPGEVDALANGGDALFYELRRNQATLLVSFQGDPPSAGIPIAVWYELPVVPPGPNSTGPRWAKFQLVNDPNTLNDLDALEVWGPNDSTGLCDGDDADFYSLQGDPGGVSIFWYNKANGVSTPYVFQPVIQAAVVSLGYTGPTVDLDALMLYENLGILGDHIWNTGDTIIFSIRAAGNWDGGEIVVLGWNAVPGAGAFFLYHDSHTWNTAFPVATTFDLDPATEEVDAIEAYPYNYPTQTPTLTQWGLIILVALLIASTVFIVLRRRKAVVPA